MQETSPGLSAFQILCDRFSCSSSSQGALQDWEWWEITLLAGGLVFAALGVWLAGQLLCSTECQEECIEKHCCGRKSQEEEEA